MLEAVFRVHQGRCWQRSKQPLFGALGSLRTSLGSCHIHWRSSRLGCTWAALITIRGHREFAYEPVLVAAFANPGGAAVGVWFPVDTPQPHKTENPNPGPEFLSDHATLRESHREDRITQRSWTLSKRVLFHMRAEARPDPEIHLLGRGGLRQSCSVVGAKDSRIEFGLSTSHCSHHQR